MAAPWLAACCEPSTLSAWKQSRSCTARLVRGTNALSLHGGRSPGCRRRLGDGPQQPPPRCPASAWAGVKSCSLPGCCRFTACSGEEQTHSRVSWNRSSHTFGWLLLFQKCWFQVSAPSGLCQHKAAWLALVRLCLWWQVHLCWLCQCCKAGVRLTGTKQNGGHRRQ